MSMRGKTTFWISTERTVVLVVGAAFGMAVGTSGHDGSTRFGISIVGTAPPEGVTGDSLRGKA